MESLADWCSFTTGLLEAMHFTKPPGLDSGSYTWLWFARSLLSSSAILPVEGLQGVTVKEFATAFPDGKDWLALFPKQSISQAMSACRYSESPLFFTLHLCTIGSADMNFDFRWLRKHASKINQKREHMASEIQMSPRPASCCRAVLEASRRGA